MKAVLSFIGDAVGYWLWLLAFCGFFAVIALGFDNPIGKDLVFLFTIALLGKIAYGIIKK
ncbi:MAG: hypothetical protein PHQ59_01910 [Candidatus Daviesbacteria bacterium]|nr:hypothetical protein [Candidatus Daviesbacteria bacterium]